MMGAEQTKETDVRMQCMTMLGFMAADAVSSTDISLQYQENIIWMARAIEVGERAVTERLSQDKYEEDQGYIKRNLRDLKKVLTKQECGTKKLSVSVEIHGTSQQELNGQSGEWARGILSGTCILRIRPTLVLTTLCIHCLTLRTNLPISQVWRAGTLPKRTASTSNYRTDETCCSGHRT